MNTRELQITDFPSEIFEELSKQLSDFTVGFVKLLDQPSRHDAFLAGSGTLVKIGERSGILTAHHVVSELPTHGQFGLVLSLNLHRYTIDAARVSLIQLDRGKDDSRGPDLGFVELEERDVENILARKSFLNIALHDEKLAKAAPDILEGVWVIIGFVDEGTKKESGKMGFSGVRAFKCFSGFGGVERPYCEGLYDYYEMRVSHSERSVTPKDFSGLSGGGLWQAILCSNPEGKFQVEELHFSGVPFFQQALNSDESIIRCHGRNSVYRKFPELLEKLCEVG